MSTKKITDLVKLTDLDATDSLVVNDSSAGADKRVEFSDLQSEVLNGAAIGTSTAITELQVDNLNLNGNTFSSTDTNGNILIQPNGTGATVINESGAASDFRVEGDTDTDLLFVDASADRVGISTNAPSTTFHVAGSTLLDGAVTINESGANVDFRVEGDTEQNLLFVDASADRVGIGTTSPSSLLTVAGATLLTGNAPVFRQTDTGSNADFGWQPTTNDYRLFNFNTSTETVRFLAGGGITFNGDTAAANALDDYEEGTWTPVYESETGTFGSITYDANTKGRYTKIGNKVYIEGVIRTDAITVGTASGAVYVAGLPFNTSSETPFSSCYIGYTFSFGGDNPMEGYFSVNNDYLNLLYRTSTNTNSIPLDVADLGTGSNSNYCMFGGYYTV